MRDLYVGKKIKQNEVFYQTGDYGRATGVHAHVCCIRGKYKNDYWIQTAYGSSCSPYAIPPTSALFVPYTTNVVETKDLQFVRLK